MTSKSLKSRGIFESKIRTPTSVIYINAVIEIPAHINFATLETLAAPTIPDKN